MPSPRPRAALLRALLLSAMLLVSSAAVPVNECPEPLDCALMRRHFCTPGSSHCGPCLAPLVENENGQCTNKTMVVPLEERSHKASLPELDEEIDLLSSIIEKQEVSKLESSAKSGAHLKTPQSTPLNATVTSSTSSPPRHQPVPVATRRSGPLLIPYSPRDLIFVVLISLCVVLGAFALILAAVCWVRMQKSLRLAQKVDYPAYGVGGSDPSEKMPVDKNLAQSAQMYHYQHQKQQMLSMERSKDNHKVPDSGTTSDEENEDGDFTVYECPGLAPTGEMEVKNPLFDDCGPHSQRKPK